MLSSINPFGERAKGNRFGVTASAYIVGSLVGGAALGAAAGLVARVVSSVAGSEARALLFGGIAIVAFAVDHTIRRRQGRLPSWRRQVSETWLSEYRGTVYGFGFGVQLGFGLATIVTSTVMWVMVIAMALQPSGWASVAVGVVFGLARGLSLLIVAGVNDTGALRRHLRQFSDRAETARRVTEAALLASGVILVGTVVAA